MKPRVSVRNVLVREREVLLGLDGEKMLWDLPGGKVRRETPRCASLRLQQEQTGLTLLGDSTCLDYLESPDLKKLTLYIRWTLWSGELRRLTNSKKAVWKWFSLDNLPSREKLTVSARYFSLGICPGLFIREEDPPWLDIVQIGPVS